MFHLVATFQIQSPYDSCKYSQFLFSPGNMYINAEEQHIAAIIWLRSAAQLGVVSPKIGLGIHHPPKYPNAVVAPTSHSLQKPLSPLSALEDHAIKFKVVTALIASVAPRNAWYRVCFLPRW